MRHLTIAAALACLLPGVAWGQAPTRTPCTLDLTSTSSICPISFGTNAMGTLSAYVNNLAGGATIAVQTTFDDPGSGPNAPPGPHWTTIGTTLTNGPMQGMNVVGAQKAQIIVTVAGTGTATIATFLVPNTGAPGVPGGTVTAISPATTGTQLQQTSVTSGSPVQVAPANVNGGWIQDAGTGCLCISDAGTAGLSSSGPTSCLQANQIWQITPKNSNAVSVNAKAGVCPILGAYYP